MGTVTSVGSGNYETGSTWDSGARAGNADDVVIASGHNVTLAQDEQANSLTIESGGTLTITGATRKIRIDSENSSGFAADIDGAIVESSGGKLRLDIETPAATKLDLMGSSGNVHDLVINHASCDAFLEANTTTTGNLTITLGKLTCTTEAGDARTLNVAGYAEIGPASGSADQATLTATSQDLLLGSGLTSSHALIVNQGGTFVGGSGTHTIGSLNIKNNTNCKCTLTSGDTTINGENGSTSKAINIEGSNGAVNFSHGSGTVIITFNGNTDIKADGVTLALNNLTINHASANVTLKSILTCAGNLTITSGELDTHSSNFALTVTGDMLVATGGTFTGNSSAVIMRSLELQGSATFSAPDASGSCTINGRKNGTSRCIDVGNNDNNFSGNGGTLTFTSANGGDLQGFEHLSAADELNNLTINVSDGSGTFYLMGDTTVTGNLTITAGTLTTNNGSADKDLTVTGTTTIGPASGAADQATLTCNASTISLGTGRQQADYAVNIETGGTFTGGTGTHTFGALYMSQSANAKATMTTGVTTVNGYNTSANKAWRVEYGGDTFDNANGTVKFHLNGFTTRMSMRGASHANNAFHNLIIEGDTSARQISPDNGSKIIVDNDLTITNGKLVMGMSHALEVGGDVEIDDASGTATLEMGSSSNISSQAATFGSLTIGGSGTYKATSGTTTITSMTSTGSGDRSLSLVSGGTFTNNSGTVLFNGGADQRLQMAGTGNLYNLTVNKADNEFVTFGNLTILNNLDVTLAADHTWRPNATSDTLTVHGNTYLTTGRINNGSTQYAGVNNWGNVTINSGEFVLSSGTNNFTGIRNIGGTVSQS